MRQASTLAAEARAGILTAVNLSPIDVGYGLMMVSAFGLLYAGEGIAAAFLAVIVGNLVPAVIGRSGQLFAGARPAQTLLIAELLAQVARNADATPDFSVLFAYLAICTILAGSLQMALGLLRAGSVVKYLPVPVLAGYINAVALLIILSAASMILGFPRSITLADMWTGFSSKTLWSAGMGLVLLALMAWVNTHYKKIHWSVAGLFGGIALYYLFSALHGERFGDNLPAVAAITPPWDSLRQFLAGNLPLPVGDLARTVLPYAMAIAMLNAIETLLAAARAEEISGRRCDANQVLIDQGVTNMLGGLIGALPIAPSISRVNIGWDLGGRRFHSLGTAAATAAAIMAFGGPLIHWVPKLVVGAVMAFLAWTMIDAWSQGQIRKLCERHKLEDSLRRQVQTNITIMLAVIAVAFSGHLIAAMFAGALLAMFLFVRDYSRSVIGRSFAGSHRHSVVMRTEQKARHLESAGHCIHVIELNAPIVFGTADRLLNHLTGLSSQIRFLILDCQRVREIDDKGARIFVRIARQLKELGVELHLSFMQPDGPRGSTLKDAGLLQSLPLRHWHADTDQALEAVEETLIAEANFPDRESMDLHHLDITAGLDEAELTILHRHLHADCYPAGGKVFSHGAAGDRFYIVAIGQVEIRLPMADRQGTMRRIAAFPPGVIFGEMAMFNGSPRSADAIAVGETSLWQLSSESLNQLKAEYPEVAGKLMYNIARQLSARLSVTNDELVYATRS